jgi:hypothetical protein
MLNLSGTLSLLSWQSSQNIGKLAGNIWNCEESSVEWRIFSWLLINLKSFSGESQALFWTIFVPILMNLPNNSPQLSLRTHQSIVSHTRTHQTFKSSKKQVPSAPQNNPSSLSKKPLRKISNSLPHQRKTFPTSINTNQQQKHENKSPSEECPRKLMWIFRLLLLAFRVKVFSLRFYSPAQLVVIFHHFSLGSWKKKLLISTNSCPKKKSSNDDKRHCERMQSENSLSSSCCCHYRTLSLTPTAF